jgi:4-amino-4-deoxy-L-arabinose transferase-like glycosyltransferase
MLNIKPCKGIFIIFIGALVLRLCYVVFFPQVIVAHDASDYDNLGRQIADGKGFSQLDGAPTAHRPPLYPFVLSIFYYLFGHNYLAVRIFQSFISASFCPLIYILAKQLLMDKRIAVCASALAAVYPAFISYSGLILTEIITGFLFLAMVYFLIIALQNNVPRFYILSGIFLGLLILCRQEMLLLVIVLPPALMIMHRNKQNIILRSLIVSIMSILVISPWTMRNYCQFKAFVPVATSTGTTFWKDTHPANFLEWEGTSEYEPVKSLLKGLDINKAESQIFLDKALLKEGFRNIISHPFIYARLCLEHLIRFCIGSHSDSFLITRDSFVNVIFRREFGVLLIKLLLLGINLFLLFLAGLGIFVSRPKIKGLFLILLPVLYVAGIHTVFFGTARYHVPVMPLILIFSAMGIKAIGERYYAKSI